MIHYEQKSPGPGCILNSKGTNHLSVIPISKMKEAQFENNFFPGQNVKKQKQKQRQNKDKPPTFGQLQTDLCASDRVLWIPEI